jgi:hypothetical protein
MLSAIRVKKDGLMGFKAWASRASFAAVVAVLGACGGSGGSGPYLVTTSIGPGGTITPATVHVERGETASFLIEPFWDHETLSVSGCDGTLSGDTFVTGPIRRGCLVTVEFAPLPGQTCVSTADDLQVALSSVGESGQDEILRLVAGEFSHELGFYAEVPAGMTLEIDGGYATGCSIRQEGGATTLDGEDERSVLTLDLNEGAGVHLRNLTVANGLEGQRAAGLEVWGASPGTTALLESLRLVNNSGEDFFGTGLAALTDSLRFTDNVVEDNAGVGGTAVRAWCRQCEFEDNVFRGNESVDGAGALHITGELVAPADNASPVAVGVARNHFEENDGYDAGALLVEGAALVTVNDNQFIANTAELGGGANLIVPPMEENGRLEVSGNFFVGNVAELAAGGLAVKTSVVTALFNNLFEENAAGEVGGGALVESGEGNVVVAFTNNTFVKNEAELAGGGIYTAQMSNTSVVRLTNNAITHNIAPRGADAFLDNDGNRDFVAAQVVLLHNAFSQGSTVEITLGLPSAQGNIDVSSQAYADFPNGDYRPAPDSPLIDAGLATDDVPPEDILGTPRDENPDIGAFESE